MNYCNNCAIKLYNTKHYNLQGIGNPWSSKCIVIPNVDYNAYKHGSINFSNQVSIIKQSTFSTGELDEILYIVPLIRCNETISCKLDKASYTKCLNYFKDDIIKYDFKDILLLGDAGRRFLNCNISSNLDNVFVSKNNRRYVMNYAPFVKLIDVNKYDIFKIYLNKWLNSVINNDFGCYNIIKL